MTSSIDTHGVTLDARNAGLDELTAVLRDQRARALDLIVSPSKYRMQDGRVVIEGADVLLDDDGTTDPNGSYSVTKIADESLADKLGIHPAYMRKMRETGRTDLLDANVNGWLHGHIVPRHAADGGAFPALGKNLMLRILRGDESGTGVLRAVVSDRYARIDNLDVLVAALGGVRDAGVDGQVTQCDLTERRMYVTLEAPQVTALAPVLLAGYRNPFGTGGIERLRTVGVGYGPVTDPIVHAGIRISNSETGDGRFRIAPHIKVKICNNGLTINADALASQHLGGKLDEGVIEWSAATTRKALELIASQARDAVEKFLSPAYIAAKVAEFERIAGVPVTDPVETITLVSKSAKFPTDLADEILSAFIAGGQLTAGGVMQAVTAAAQTVTDADIAALMESEAVNVLTHAARIG